MDYFCIGNIHPKKRSSLKNIHLLSIHQNRQISQFGLNELVRPIANDLKLLEDGVDMVIKGRTVKIYGTFAALTADNLASYAIGGFMQCFSRGFRKCRYCLATEEDIEIKFTDKEFVPARTKEDHALQCAGLTTNLART